MRNIFLLPAKDGVDSDLFYHCALDCEKTLQYMTQDRIHRNEMLKAGINKPQFVYITTEATNEDTGWVIVVDDFETYIHKLKGDNRPTTYYAKIILTNDPALIKDDVQQVSIDFLEWFVKNPTCDYWVC